MRIALYAMSALRVVCAAAVLAAAPAWAQLATPEEVQSPLLVLQHLPYAASHDRIQVKTYDFKELGAPSEYQLFVPSKYDRTKPDDEKFILDLCRRKFR